MAKGRSVSGNNAATEREIIPGPLTMEFRFVHYPNGWEPVLTDKDALLWLPVLKRGYLTAGLNNCTSKTARGIQPTRVGWQAAGGKEIPLSAPVIISEAGKLVEKTDRSYLTAYDGKTGEHFADVWSNPLIIGEGVDWTSDYDTEGWEATLALWERKGYLNKRMINIEMFHASLLSNAVEQLSRREKLSDISQAKLDTKRKLLALIQANRKRGTATIAARSVGA